jgi:Na+-driven multidrug efflux pump
MWLVILGYGAVIATALWYVSKAKGEDLCLNYLATILWGATLMFFIDHLFSYIRGEGFMDISADAVALGFSLLLVALVIWLVILFIKDPKKVLRKT